MSHDDRNPGVVIKLRRDTTANWATDNPVLAEGETGWDTDLRRVKLGDGVTAWLDLPWAADEAASVTAETARAEAAEAGLDSRVDSLEATEATYGDIVTHNASEFTTDAELAAEATLARNADNLDNGTVDDTRLTARLSGLAGLSLADGQLIRYDNATGVFVALNPVGNSELAVGENITTATTGLATTGGAGTIVAIPFTAISISNSNGRPVTLEYQAQYIQTVAGAGTAFLLVYETTSGATAIAWTPSPLPNSTAASLSQRPWPVMQKRIGVVSTTRTFELRAYLLTAAGVSANANVINGTQQGTILRAVAG